MTYTDELKRAIEHIREHTKAERVNRPARLRLIDEASTKYALAHASYADAIRATYIEKGNEPPMIPMDERLLEQLANLALYEELTDTTAHKSRQSEYPFLSDMQLARRQTGKHGRGGEEVGEAPLTAAMTKATDGRDYRTPTRRKRSQYEDKLRDAKSKIRNDERRRKYNEFTRVQPVFTYKMGKIVD